MPILYSIRIVVAVVFVAIVVIAFFYTVNFVFRQLSRYTKRSNAN